MSKLANLLEGKHNFTIQGDWENSYEFTLIVYSKNDSIKTELNDMLAEIIPENIFINVIYETEIVGDVYLGVQMFTTDIIEIRQR